MEKYIGVKFSGIRKSDGLISEVTELYPIFRRNCEKLAQYNMTRANEGNISLRHGSGMVITGSGSQLGNLETGDLIFVDRCEIEEERVSYCGPVEPSSETFMHWMIYQEHPEVMSVVHAHDEFATRPEILTGEVEQTVKEEPYGTMGLAKMAIAAFRRAERIIVLKNHGYVAIGQSLDQACDLIVETHNRLLAKKEGT